MDQIEIELNKLNVKIDAIEEFLKKPFKNWTEEEIDEHGSKEQLRRKEEQLREERKQLREQQNILLRIKERDDGIQKRHSMDVDMHIDITHNNNVTMDIIELSILHARCDHDYTYS